MSDDIFPTPEQMQAANSDLVALVRRDLPQRFYQGEKWWKVFVTAGIVRLADCVETIMSLLDDRRDADAAVLIRSLFEQTITLSWVAIDPPANYERWKGQAAHEELKIHRDGLKFGETLMSPQEVAVAEAAPKMPNLADRAKEADEYWTSRVSGLHGPAHLLGFRGLYMSIYRTRSRSTHASVAALDLYVTMTNRKIIVDRAEPDAILWYALVAPVFGMALVILGQHFNWLGAREKEVREVVDRATAAPPPAAVV